jgi:hypothetical protein
MIGIAKRIIMFARVKHISYLIKIWAQQASAYSTK